MPFTLAHPAAVLPLRRLTFLQTVPLIIGSITPDLPYYVPGRIARAMPETHTFFGSFAVCVPVGFILLVCGFLLRRPLTALMSARARWLCLRALERFRNRPLYWALAPLSILLGTWTHIAWDSFTHADGWMVRRVPALSAPVAFGWYTGELCHILQYGSSAIGLAVLAIWYRRLPAPALEPASAGSVRTSAGLVLLLVVVAAIVIGGLQAAQYAGHAQTIYRIIYLLLTRIIAWFAVLYLAAGTLVMLNRRPEPELQS
jgi:hypothetical protein